MSNPLRAPRGTTTSITSRILLDGELAYNTTTDRLHVGDGVTLGGQIMGGPLDDDWADVVESATIAAGTALIDAGNPFTDVASATSVDLGAVASDKVRITGSTGPIASFGTASAGVRKLVRLASNPTITYHAVNMILPGDASIVGAADDSFDAVSLGSGAWYIANYKRARSADVFNVKDYGATGDGSTDDTSFIAAAITAATAGSGILVPPGTYIVSNLAITKSLTFFSYGEGAVLKHKSSTVSNMIDVTGAGHKVTFSAIVFDGNETNQAAQSDNASLNSTADGGASADTLEIICYDCEFRNPAYAGVRMTGDLTASTREKLTMINPRFRDGRQAVDNNPSNDYLPSDIRIHDGVEFYILNADHDSGSAPTTGRSAFVIAASGSTDVSHGYYNGKVNRRGCATTQTLGAIDLYAYGANMEIDAVVTNSAACAIKGKAWSEDVKIRATIDTPASGYPGFSWNNPTSGSSLDALDIDVVVNGAASAAAMVVNSLVGSDYSKGIRIRALVYDCTGEGIQVSGCKNFELHPHVIGGTIGLNIQNCIGFGRIIEPILIGQSSYQIYSDTHAGGFDTDIRGGRCQDCTRTGYANYFSGRIVSIQGLIIDNADLGLSSGTITTMILDGVQVRNLTGTVGIAPGVLGAGTITNLHVKNCISYGMTTPFTVAGATITNAYVDDSNSWALLSGSATWDAASIADGDEEVKSITVTGAALGDYVVGCSLSIDVADLQLSAQVTGTDTVKAQLLNNTGGAIDLGSATVRVLVRKRY